MKIALFLVGLLLAGSSWANIGSITELTGSATIKRGKETITVNKGSVIETNDKIETKNGKLTIVFKDDTNVKVSEHSSLIIDDFVYDPKAGKGKLDLKAAGGAVRYTSGAIAKDPKAVNIRTPTAAIAVRGTDFVMAVNEIGASVVVLMPTCDWESSAVKGVTCGSSGKIDVESGSKIITLDKPYEATVVETLGAAPSPPMIVAPTSGGFGTNLLISEPKTASGRSVVAAARAAIDKTDENKKEDSAKEEHKTAGKGEGQSNKRADGDDGEKTKVIIDTNKLDIAVGDVGKENPNVKKIWKDKSETQQIGWQYESLSSNGNNYANIALPMDTKALVIVTQDRVTDAFNFNTQSSKSYGLIVINQTYR
jgi:hypothetical protein